VAPDRWARRALFAVIGVLVVVSSLYGFVMWEGSSSRADAPAWEKYAAQWLLHRTVPAVERVRRNPLSVSMDPADVAAGRTLYREKCEICHGYDGSGKTEIGAGEYPRPPDLRAALVQTQNDGELYFHVVNGIRHTGMPGWTLAERQAWELILYIRHLPGGVSLEPDSRTAASGGVANATFVGSRACARCHAAIYDRWKTTRMANVVRDPREHPDAIAPDLAKPDPLVTFTRDEIAFVYGSRWKQRYFTKVGDDYFPLPAQWDFKHQLWRAYFVKAGTDWWESFYPPDNMKRPTGPLCDGCHSVNYDIATKQVSEWNVGCERCHGPGSDHVMRPRRDTIVNPARLDYVHANDVCMSCHSQGQPLNNPVSGKYYDWPVGYQVGKHLSDFWKLEPHTLGVQSFTHFADGTGHKNRMQGNDFVQSLMYSRGVTCFSCHDPHGSANDSMLLKPGGQVCLDCHGPNTQNGPHAASIEAHTHHATGSAGNECPACHMPKLEQTIADVNVHAHTFKFITPSQTATLNVPNPCGLCHADKPAAWIAATLNSWTDRSPWRMSQ
jgi:predicted CXXCH cytochrome family protein